MRLIGKLLRYGLVALAIQLPAATSVFAQMDDGPPVEKKYGVGLPRDHATTLFTDAQYPVYPLKSTQKAYADINGNRMKQDIIALSKVALKYRDTVNSQWWGRFPGTTADAEGVKYMLDEFKRLGLQTSSVPYALPTDWRPTSWDAKYASNGATINLTTIFPASGTKVPPPEGITAEAVWLGVGGEPDFAGRNVAGKAVIIYSTFVPGGRSHSASDRANLFNANTRAADKGAALIINVMAVPGNGQFQPEGGNTKVTQMTLSQDEGFALRDRLAAGERVTITLHLNVPPLANVQTAYHWAILPGQSDEQIMIQMHTDGYFQAAEDNNGGMASGLELARHYAALPIHNRPRTMVFLMFPDHHHGEYAHRVLIDPKYDWTKVALKLTLEHPSETQLYMYNDSITPSNAMSATRWNALGSPEFERMCLEQLIDFGNSVYGVEDGPKNGAFAPSFHTINHIIYHTSLDTPEMVPAEGQARATRAFASIIDKANQMSIAQLKGPGWPYDGDQGSIHGPIIPQQP
jgi:hypothetical protein